ncbi:MAG: FAD-dependent monooxygenase [Gammaproteobacteria bacterium]|nr:FAD-dependent monooxygenase [Gammaproteobacteria bacterium]
MSQIYDVVVVGGGLVGLSTALLLRQATAASSDEFRIAVVEAHPPILSVEDELPDVGLRVSALSPASAAILSAIGVWQSLVAKRVSPYHGMCVWQADVPIDEGCELRFSAAELDSTELGFIVENDLLREELWRAAISSADIELLPASSPEALRQEDDASILALSDGSEVKGRLMVAADGANSCLRQLLGVQLSGSSYGQRGIVAHVQSEMSHENTAWQRFLQTGPIALLPLEDGRCSLVWSCEEALADELLLLDDAEFSIRLTAATEGVLGMLTCITPRVAFPLAFAHATEYSGSRFALVGDAAHRVHPLAGQGVNLGLLDAAALAETIGSQRGTRHADAGDALVLRRYARWRRRDNELTLGMMNLLHRVFAGNTEGSSVSVARIAGRGLGLVNSLNPLKRRFAEHALGRGGDLPKVANRQ